MAWLYKNEIYKRQLLKRISSVGQNNLVDLFHYNSSLALTIIEEKYYTLLNINIELLKNVNPTWVTKIKRISESISIYDTLWLFNKVTDINNITKNNAKFLMVFFEQYDNFKENKIEIKWGKGNHNDAETNLNEHYKKHLLSEEGYMWKNVLDCMDVNSYKEYAIKSFYNMNNIVIHTDGNNIYISGFINKIFIVGKYSDNTFSISSCYYVESGEKKGRHKTSLYKIDKW